MSAKRTNILLAELKESFLMAMGALSAHKLRSALTLLGVLVGVFSIIVVMTAMRVMQSDIEHQISQLGSQTFMALADHRGRIVYGYAVIQAQIRLV